MAILIRIAFSRFDFWLTHSSALSIKAILVPRFKPGASGSSIGSILSNIFYSMKLRRIADSSEGTKLTITGSRSVFEFGIGSDIFEKGS